MTISTRYSSRPDFRPLSKTQSPSDTAASGVGQSPSPTSPTSPTSTTPTAETGYSGQSSFEPAPATGGVVQEHEFGGAWRRAINGGYALPTERHNEAVWGDDAQRSRGIAQAQEDVVRGAGGQPVPFTNSNGQTEALQFTQEGENWRVADANNNSILIRGQDGLSPERLLESTAEIADYWSQTPAHLRNATPTIDVYPGHRDATYTNENAGVSGDGAVMSIGARNLDEASFDHETGHGIGWGNPPYNGRPTGWDEAMQADGSSVSQYANKNEREDFAESWLAYMEARELGPDQLAELQQAYPNRFNILEQVYNGTLQP